MTIYTVLHNLRKIHEMPTTIYEVEYPTLGVYEGRLRAFNILAVVKEMLNDKRPIEEILLSIKLMEEGFK